MRSSFLIFIGCLYISTQTVVCIAQEIEIIKTETEFRIDNSEVPQKAKAFISNFKKSRKFKWLREEGENGASIEAKFKFKGSRYSIEFTPQGVLEDVEVVIDYSEIPVLAREQIDRYFINAFDYFKIEKTQAQYIDSELNIYDFFIREKVGLVLKPYYEIVIKTRNSGEKSQRFEILFDHNGQFINRSQITIRRDNILRF
ncbi:hypothetical protein [Dokdonia sp. Hel_I_53]|uniref:hypothetical protein n=1 Tax=Dokdonia sp. Hel_I_53 TaxID=1566287 RepID=UPI00119B3E0F|nr:hypothetical protein [Dokdonia sp. Hel_I_53]TVZ52524.1 hypothetical protein OD90_1701 [Dokdonia sp. Hel_I_53]